VAEQLTSGGPRCNSGATWVGVAGGELGELPGGEVGLWRGLAVVGVQRCSETMTEQGLYVAEQGWDGARVWGVSHRIGDKGARGLGDPICGAGGHPRRVGSAPRLTGDLGRPLRVGEEREEGERVLTSGAKQSEGGRERERKRVLRWRVRRGAPTGGPHAPGRGRSRGAAGRDRLGRGRNVGRRGRKEVAGHATENGPREGLGRWAGVLSYFLSFSFSNQLKSI
jgi:hypothetical protein